MDRRKKLVIIGGIVLVVAGAAGFGIYNLANKSDDKKDQPIAEKSVKERIGAKSVESIKSGARDNKDAIYTLISTASILEKSGDPEGAEEYYKAALDHAKTGQDQEMIDTSYRLLFAYYKSAGNTEKYNALENEVGEANMQRIIGQNTSDGEPIY